MLPNIAHLRGTAQLLVITQFLNVLGTAASLVALPWFVLENGGSLGAAGLVMAAEVLPLVLLGPKVARTALRVSGPVATMVACDAMRALLLAAIPVATMWSELPLTMLMLLVASAGLLGSPHYAAQRVVLASLAHDEDATLRLNAGVAAATHVANLAGPLAAAALIAIVDVDAVLLFNGGTFLACAALLVPLRGHVAPHDPAQLDARERRSGARMLLHDMPHLRAPTVSCALLDGFTVAVVVVAAVAMASESQLGPHGGAVALAAYGVGAVCANILLTRFAPRIRAARIYRPLAVLTMLPTLVFLAADFTLALLGGTLFLVGVAGGAGGTACMSVIMSDVPDTEQGEAFATVLSINHAVMAASYIAAGLLADAAGGAGVIVGVLVGVSLLGAWLVRAPAQPAQIAATATLP